MTSQLYGTFFSPHTVINPANFLSSECDLMVLPWNYSAIFFTWFCTFLCVYSIAYIELHVGHVIKCKQSSTFDHRALFQFWSDLHIPNVNSNTPPPPLCYLGDNIVLCKLVQPVFWAHSQFRTRSWTAWRSCWSRKSRLWFHEYHIAVLYLLKNGRRRETVCWKHFLRNVRRKTPRNVWRIRCRWWWYVSFIFENREWPASTLRFKTEFRRSHVGLL